jgi:hypothetical protein
LRLESRNVNRELGSDSAFVYGHIYRLCRMMGTD